MITVNKNNIRISEHELPLTYDIIINGNLTFDNRIKMAFISGSRGPLNCFKQNSDIDICMILDQELVKNPIKSEADLLKIIKKTINNWNNSIQIDTAILFSIKSCDFQCFYSYPNEYTCTKQTNDCFGIFKIQKGFKGFVPSLGIDINKIYPIKIIWTR